MLAKKYRLPAQSVSFKKGTSVRGRYFLFTSFPSPLSYSRVAVVVSKKVCPKATGRNNLKRFVYEFFRKQSPKRNKDLLISALPPAGATEADRHAMIKELESNTASQ